jgi:hypothetical protein
VSNFFEHFDSREHIRFILEEAFRLLKPAGRIIVIQPNIALTGDAYWDIFNHIVPLSDNCLSEAMELVGFRKILVKRRFLPYSTKKMKMHSTFLFRTYLAWLCIQWVLGRQSLIIAEKPDA